MIKNKNYKLGSIGKKICLIADIHYSKNYNIDIFKEIIDNIKTNKPDFICISGDLVDDASVLKISELSNILTEFIKELSKNAPLIITKGNHDKTVFIHKKHYYIDSNEYFSSLNKLENVYYLNNKTLIRDKLSFTGINLDYKWYYDKNHEDSKVFADLFDSKISKIDKSKYNILLCHTPSCIMEEEVIKKSKQLNKFDLILSGHMHNGLVMDFFDKKFNRGLVGPYKKFFPKYARGKIEKEINNKKISLVISGGIIKFADNSPKLFKKLNFLYPIHIDYIEI